MFSLHEGIHTPRWSCCRLCSDWSRWSPSAPSPRGASSCCPSTLSPLCTHSLEHGTASPPTLEFGAKSLLPTTHWLWLTLAPWDQGCSPLVPGLSSSTQTHSSSASIPPLPLRALQLRDGPGKRLFILSKNAWLKGFSFQESPCHLQVFPKLMLSKG